jgi:beta-phosphoglucomutase-like phosphatase (HAD superfamily)
MVAAIIFDLDGLLSDTERLHYQAYQEVLRQYDIQLTETEYADHWIRSGKSLTDWARAKDSLWIFRCCAARKRNAIGN